MRKQKIQDQEGQTLILFALMCSVLILFIALVVDVGMFLQERRNAQNVVDAAALAAAQELPDDPTTAALVARDYATRNGFDPNLLDITFRCTTTTAFVCNPAANKYDTIVVKATVTSPTYFSPVLTTMGGSGLCWVDGCSSQVQAAGCRGLCGAAGDEVDAMIALDHTGSMAATELQNARDGALQLMKIFDPAVHQIGLTVVPPVHGANHCDTVETWLDLDRTWMPDGLTNSYATSKGSLNVASQLVKDTQCLDLAGNGDVPGPHTDLAEPFRAAMNELNAHGRSGAKHGIVFLTDGAANVYGDPAAAALAGARGPCDYASKMATQAKAAGIEVYTIGYGVDENCTKETALSPWNNKPVASLLLSMATDATRFYNQPKTADLDPVFQAIGLQLATGSKLVQ